jgi:ubiquinone/menaquinone biosynthesis C-methylase UbiE
MERAHQRIVEAQFGPRATAYVESAVHAQGSDLEAIEVIVRDIRPPRALDLGAGGGHVSYLMAPYAGEVTAIDVSTDMLAAVAATAHKKGLSNVETVQAPAQQLPFNDGAFDFLACRFSAHHWCDFDGGLRQARRVLKRSRRAVFIDACSPGPALLDTHLQAVELLRDTSHVRNYAASEWTAALTLSGFGLINFRTWWLRMEFLVWTARMSTPEENVRAIRTLQTAASAEAKAHFAIEADGSFQLDILMIEAMAE